MPLKISTVFGIHFKQRQINGSVICEIRDSLQDNTVINSALNNSLYRSLSLANGCVVLISVGCRQRCRLTSLTFVFLVPTIRSIRCKCHLFCRSRHAPVTSTQIRYQENKRFDAVPRQPSDIKCSGFKEKHALKNCSTFESGESEFIFT